MTEVIKAIQPNNDSKDINVYLTPNVGDMLKQWVKAVKPPQLVNTKKTTLLLMIAQIQSCATYN